MAILIGIFKDLCEKINSGTLIDEINKFSSEINYKVDVTLDLCAVCKYIYNSKNNDDSKDIIVNRNNITGLSKIQKWEQIRMCKIYSEDDNMTESRVLVLVLWYLTSNGFEEGYYDWLKVDTCDHFEHDQYVNILKKKLGIKLLKLL